MLVSLQELLEEIAMEVYQKDRTFWNQIEHDELRGCWIPTTLHHCHERYKLTKRNGKSYLSHRHAWLLRHGVLLDSDIVCHTCDRGYCVKPSHLFRGTEKDNKQDMVMKGRAHSQKLTIEDVKNLREEYAAGECTMRDLAKKYAISSSSISDIINRRAWWYI